MRSSFIPDLTFCTAIKSKRARILATLAPWQKFTLIAIVIVALVGLSYTIIRPASGEILDGEDNDFFTFNYSGNAWDLIAIVLQNKSTTLRPWLEVYNRNKFEILSQYDNTPGSDLEVSFKVVAGESYFIQVRPLSAAEQHLL